MQILYYLLFLHEFINEIHCQNDNNLIVHLNSGSVEGRILETPAGNRARAYQVKIKIF